MRINVAGNKYRSKTKHGGNANDLSFSTAVALAKEVDIPCWLLDIEKTKKPHAPVMGNGVGRMLGFGSERWGSEKWFLF